MPEDMDEGIEVQDAESEMRDGFERVRLLIEQARTWLTGSAGSKT